MSYLRSSLVDLSSLKIEDSILFAWLAVIVDGLILIALWWPSFLFSINLVFHKLILKRRYRQKILKEKIEKNQGVELQIGVVLLIQAHFDSLHHDLWKVQSFLVDVLYLHRFRLRPLLLVEVTKVANLLGLR